MDELVSIIVPVYNVSAYLRKCVESLVNQTYERIEIILVDDGSTDNSGLLCDEWKKTDSRIVVIHKKNGGLSDARNAGIQFAKGAYMTFVDGDDRLTSNACEVLLDAAKRNSGQIVVAGLMLESTSGEVDYEESLCGKEQNVSSQDALKLVFQGRGYSACGKLYHKEVFSDIRFPKGKLDEDFATMYKLFLAAENITYIPEYVYYYFSRTGSITKSAFSVQKLDFASNAEEAAVYIRQRFPDSEISARADAFLCRRIDMVIHLIVFDENRENYLGELVRMVKRLRTQWRTVLFSPFVDKMDRVVMLSEMVNPNIYRLYKLRKR